MENLHGFQFDKSEGHNSPNGTWYEAESDGRKYFLKKFQWPKYPKDGSSSSIFDTKKQECDNWLKQKNRIISALNEIGDGAGNIVSPRIVFREKLCFYQATYWINANVTSLDEIKRYSDDEKIMLLKTYSAALKKVHSKGIIHGDLKPENVMIGKSGSGKPVAKLIDFDDSYFSGEAFPPEQTVCTDAYQSPELAAYKQGHREYHSFLTCANDVFASAIIFHQFWTGKMPCFHGMSEGKFLYQAIAAGNEIVIDESIPQWLRELIIEMLNPLPENRPTMNQVHQCVSKGVCVSKKTPLKVKKSISVIKETEMDELLNEESVSHTESTTHTTSSIMSKSLLSETYKRIPENLSVYTNESVRQLKKEIAFSKANEGIIDDARLAKRLNRMIEGLVLNTGEISEFSIVPCSSLPLGYSRIEIISENKVQAFTSNGKKVTLPRQVALALKLVKLK